MDVCSSKHQLQKHTEVDTSRPPLVPAERNNVITSRRSQTRDISSRYRSPSPSPSTTSAPRRCQSPTHTRTLRTTSQSATKRAQSAERKRPSYPSTPLKDSSIDAQISSRKILSGLLPEGLWPSTMRSLSVSFQSDSISVPLSKKEKPVTNALSKRPLRPSSNVHKQVEKPKVTRKSTPERERERNPLIGKNAFDQSENSKPVDTLSSRLTGQHQWPSRTGGKVSLNSLARSLDVIDKKMVMNSIPQTSGNKALSVVRLSLDGVAKQRQNTGIDDRVRMGLHSIDDNHLQVWGHNKLVREKSLDKVTKVTSIASSVRSQSFNASISCPSSPRKISVLSSSVCRAVVPSRTTPTRGISPGPSKQPNPVRGISPTPTRQSTPTRGIRSSPSKHPNPARGISPTPTRESTPARGISLIPETPSTPARGIGLIPARPSTPARGISLTPARRSTPARGTSPTRIRSSNSSNQPSTSTSVLSFIADFRNGRKSSSHIEDVHQLRLVYNRYLQWRFANGRADAVLHIKKAIAEKSLYNVGSDTLALGNIVILKRIRLQRLRLELKLNSIINGQQWYLLFSMYKRLVQMSYLDDWTLLEKGHASCLSGAAEDFEACTLHLPVNGGARAHIESLKLAVCSAVDVMQTLGSSLPFLLSRVELMSSLVSELASVTLQESEMVDQCEALLASTAGMQVEEYSLRTHLIQMRQALDKP